MKNAFWLVAVAAVTAWGFGAPAAGKAIQAAGITMPLIAVIMLISGLSLPAEEIARTLRRPLPILAALFVTYVAFPVAGLFLSYALFAGELSGPDAAKYLQGFMILCAQTSTVATGIVLTTIAGGDRALSILVTIANYAASVLGTPLALALTLGGSFGADSENIAKTLGPSAIAQTLLVYVITPLMIGQVVRLLVPRLVRGRERFASPACQILILAFVLMATSSGSDCLRTQALGVLGRLVAYAVALHFAMLALAAGLAWLASRDRGVTLGVALCAGSKTLTSGMAIWQRHFHENPFGILPLAVYHVLQILIDTLLIPLFARPPDGKPDHPAPPAGRGLYSPLPGRQAA